ncbi:hypothetical protein [Actinocatenispora rupis]|uniref:DNA-directed RNA polymerase specialized sigma subunit, sigma24 family n=1 Tax=Actinocatenispora rupis TaxID=519421 RepID=A0A8J3J295_9ACTN|nr:hypothetical protein [Actinocatenispora rupis]GID10231.1 hypothetical protein Aru02nite_11200 [Actinocatenispora rupis]
MSTSTTTAPAATIPAAPAAASAGTEPTAAPVPAATIPAGPATWTRSPLATAEKAFGLLCTQPRPLSLDSTDVPGLPDGPVPLTRLRQLLLERATGREARDAIWRRLVLRAKTGRPEWVIAAVGMAMPTLRRAACRIAFRWHGDAADIDAEMLTGFLTALRAVDPDAPRLCQRLCRAAAGAGRQIRHATAPPLLAHEDYPESQAPHRPYGHPDLVLGRAVAAGVITAEEADLIGRTRLGGEPIAARAAALGVKPQAAIMRRHRAEAKLVAQIRSGRLDGLLREADPDPAGIG